MIPATISRVDAIAVARQTRCTRPASVVELPGLHSRDEGLDVRVDLWRAQR